jgi:multiple antibiotic resistance protein
VEFLLKSFLTLFVVMDPVGLVPVFLALAGDRPPREQARIARKAVLVAGAVLTFFFFFGRELLAYLGISRSCQEVCVSVCVRGAYRS